MEVQPQSRIPLPSFTLIEPLDHEIYVTKTPGITASLPVLLLVQYSTMLLVLETVGAPHLEKIVAPLSFLPNFQASNP